MEEQLNYLYGAAVQGIQSFIFQTNELKDIVGASELVEQICTIAFDEFTKDENGKSKGEFILKAAGNIKFIFDKKDDCENAVLKFPKKVMEMAPGITISQAVVIYDDILYDKNDPKCIEKIIEGKLNHVYQSFANAVDELESRLRIQRNRPLSSTTVGLMGMRRSRKTGLPAIAFGEEKDDYLDAATFMKRYEWNGQNKAPGKRTTMNLCKKSFGIKDLKGRIAYNIDEITQCNDWIAIIHADGNGLGHIVQQIGKEEKIFRDFSVTLDEATKRSAHEAYNEVKDKFGAQKEIIPIRPVVLGGDDMTAIIRGDLAVDYCNAYLSEFEKNTRDMLGRIALKYPDLNIKQKTILLQGLTACAGIAFIKSSFPFYYGYTLADKLCDKAKKDAKGFNPDFAPSCLMFHKVQDSFVENYDDIAKRELTAKDGVSFMYGPYYLDGNCPLGRCKIGALINNSIEQLKGDEGNAIKSHLRQWLSMLHTNPKLAKQEIKRLKQEKVNDIDFIEKVTIPDERNSVPVYDMLALHTIIYQKTKEDR